MFSSLGSTKARVLVPHLISGTFLLPALFMPAIACLSPKWAYQEIACIIITRWVTSGQAKNQKEVSEGGKKRYFKMLHLIEAIWFMYMTTVVLLALMTFHWLHFKWKRCGSGLEQLSLEHGWEEFGTFLPPPSVFSSELKTLSLPARSKQAQKHHLLATSLLIWLANLLPSSSSFWWLLLLSCKPQASTSVGKFGRLLFSLPPPPPISHFFFAVTICWSNTLSYEPGAPLHLQPRWTWEGFQHSRGLVERERIRQK